MNNDKIDPWNLLRKAREELGTIEALTLHPKFHNGEGGDELTNFLAEIDEALKEHDQKLGWTVYGRWGDYHGEHGEGFVVPNQVPFSELPPFFWRVLRKDRKYDEGWEDSFKEARKQANLALRRSENGQ